MSVTTVRQATLRRMSSFASRFSSASRLTAARWWGPAPGSPTSSCATPSSSSRWRISIFASICGSMAEGLWIPSRNVSSSTSARESSPRSLGFQSWNRSGTKRILRRLQEQRDALAAADAGGADAALQVAPPHLVEQVRGDARAGGAERMAHGDGAAVHVGAVAREPQLLLHREVLRSEGLVHLEEIEVVQGG